MIYRLVGLLFMTAISDTRAAAEPWTQATAEDSLSASGLTRAALMGYLSGIAAGLPSIPAPVVPNTTLAHLSLLSTRLDSAALFNPRDRRTAAIRTYVSVAVGNYPASEAIVASTCADSSWWCKALRGFVRHSAGRFAEAEADFRESLTAMPEELRCAWDDVSQIMNSRDFVAYYRSLSCGRRTQLTEQVWWLSQPLWMEPGNERRTEHYSRMVTAEILGMVSSLLGSAAPASWRAQPSTEAILRINAIEGSVVEALSACDQLKRNSAMCATLGRSDRFIPGRQPATAPFAVSVLDYALAPALAADITKADVPAPPGTSGAKDPPFQFGELYTSAYGPVYVIAEAQTAFYTRGNVKHLLAVFDPRSMFGYPDPAHGIRPGSSAAQKAPRWLRVSFANSQLKVGVSVSDRPNAAFRTVTSELLSDGPARLDIIAHFDSALVSVEARDVEWRIAARHRFAVTSPDLDPSARLTVSDVLLYDARDKRAPNSIDGAMQLMLPRVTVARDESVGLYWEVYGLKSYESPQFEIAVSPTGPQKEKINSIRTRWKAPGTQPNSIGIDGETAHAIALNLRSLRSGVYNLQLTTTVAGSNPVTVSKLLRIR